MGDIAEGLGNLCIYKIESLTTKNLYVGSTSDFKRRIRQHKHLLRKGKHYSKKLQLEWSLFKEEKFEFVLLKQLSKKDMLIEEEAYFIGLLNPLFNIFKNGNARGFKHSDDTKQKLSKYFSGVSNHTEESKKAISKFMKNNKYADGNVNSRKVTKEIYEKVISLRLEGLGCRKIAKEVALSKKTILNIFNKKFDYGYD